MRIRTAGSKVEVIIIDKAEQREQEMREAEAEWPTLGAADGA